MLIVKQQKKNPLQFISVGYIDNLRKKVLSFIKQHYTNNVITHRNAVQSDASPLHISAYSTMSVTFHPTVHSSNMHIICILDHIEY